MQKGLRWSKATLVLLMLFIFPSFGLAVEFPTKPMEWLVPYGISSITGLSMKIVGDAASKILGQQPVLIVSAQGGGGLVAGTRVARAKPDGYTLVQANSATNGVALYIYKDITYKNSDFEFLAQYGTLDLALFVRGDSQFKTLEQYVDYARKNPIKQAHAGIGTGSHMCIEQLKVSAGGLKIDIVPFKSGSELVTSVLGGHVDGAFIYGGTGGTGDTFKQVLDGGARLLAVASKKRLKAYPDVPTFTEKGFHVVWTAWYGVAGPKGMPKEVSQKLKDALYKALKDPQVIKAIEGIGLTFEFRNSEDFTHFVEEFERSIKKVVDDARIRPS